MGDTVVSDATLEVSKSGSPLISQPVQVEKQTTMDSPPGFPPLTSSGLDGGLNSGVELVNLTIEKMELPKILSLGGNSTEMAVRESVNGEKDLGLAKNVDGALLGKFAAAPTTTTPEISSGEPVKRKRGRPFKNKVTWNSPLSSSVSPTSVEAVSHEKKGESSTNGINGVSPSLASSSPKPNANQMTIHELVKKSEGRSIKMKRVWQKRKENAKVVSGKSSTAYSSAPAQVAIEMSSAELVKKRRGKQPKTQKSVGQKKGTEEAASLEPSLPRKGEGISPKIQNSSGQKKETKEPVCLVQSLPTSTAAASPRTEMSLRETVRRKAGRPPTVKRKYVRKKDITATELASSSGTNKQSTSHEEHDGEGLAALSTPPEPSSVKPSPKRGMQSPSKRGKKQKLAQRVDPSREQMEAEKDIMEVVAGLQSTFYVGDVPIPAEYENIYNEIKDRHGPLENGQPVGEKDGLSHVTLVELLKMAHELKVLSMGSVTETTLSNFERNLTIGRLFKYNVGWLEVNLKSLRDLYVKRAAMDVTNLEKDVQRCNSWLEATQAELTEMEEEYLLTKKKVDDLVKSRDDAVAKLVAARDCLGKFEFKI
ncbi:hypothetical protein ACHQM5_003841 [Ranunculus cassubicifolius]